MASAEHKDFGTPDEVRNFEKARVELVNIGGGQVGPPHGRAGLALERRT